MMDRIWARLANLVTRQRVQSASAGAAVQRVTVRERPEGMEYVEPFGFTSTPLAGAEAVVLAPGGNAAGEIVIAVGDRRYRVRGVEAGGVCLYDQEGHRVLLDSNGITLIPRGEGVRIHALASGPEVATFSGLVHGNGIDPFTGLTYAELGNTTNQIKAEKT